MEFPDDFNQLEFLETHQHLIPVGTQSMWPDDDEDDDEEDDEEERGGFRSEEWYQQQEKKLENRPGELLLWASERNRVS